jgi:predicted N-acetyltransferase YhbS
MTKTRLPDGVGFREMVVDDIPAGLALCRASGWNQVERDWHQFLTRDPHGALVAERDGRVIGTVATIRYGQRFAWIAMVLVDPSERGRGVGRALLTRGLSLLDDVETARLDATPAGEPLYRTLGFVEDSRLSRLQRAPGAASATLASPSRTTLSMPTPSAATSASASASAPASTSALASASPSASASASTSAPTPLASSLLPPAAVATAAEPVIVRPLAPADWDAVAALDARVFGAERRALLEWLAQGAPEYAFVAVTPEGLAGFVLGRHGHLFEHMGPVAASSADVAISLAAACLAAGPADRAWVVDAPTDQTAWRAWLADAGFVEQRPFARMSRGRPAPAGSPAHFFAALGPEFG